MLAKRIIPCLDVKDGRVVKGVNFLNLRDAGDPVEQARAYDAQGADELIFLDISATHEGRQTMLDVVRQVAVEVFMPFGVGGGIRSVSDIRALLLAGADKVSINSAAVRTPEILTEGAERFGSQCIVISVDAKRVSGPSTRRAGRSTSAAGVSPLASMRSRGARGPWSWARARCCSPAWMATARSPATTSS